MTPKIPRRRSTETIGTFGPYLKLQQHRLEGEPDEAMPWFTFDLPDWAGVTAITEDGRVVLVRQHRQGTNAPTLEVPGGIVDEGEDPREAAMRELREEVGFDAEDVTALGWVHPNPALQNNRYFAFLATGARPIAGWRTDEIEHTEPVLLDREDVRRGLRSGDITHALTVFAIERAFAEIGHQGFGAKDAAGDPKPQAFDQGFGAKDAAGDPKPQAFDQGFGAKDAAGDPKPQAFDQEVVARDRLARLLAEMEDLQAKKVLELARRIVPGLTAEDIRNPHDFPDLADPDWHFEDGQLSGIQAVRFAVFGLAAPREDER